MVSDIWVYLLTEKPDYPDPWEELDFLANLEEWDAEEEGGPGPHLMLASREGPPMKTAVPGDKVWFCVRQSDRAGDIVASGLAEVAGTAWEGPPPPGHEAIYESYVNRYWLPLRKVDKLWPPKSAVELGLPPHSFEFGQAQAYARKLVLGSRERWKARNQPTFALPDLAGNSYLGIDLTAGTWESRLDLGPRPFPIVELRGVQGGRLQLVEASLPGRFESLRELLADPRVRECEEVVIDGPCGAVGMELEPERSAWRYLSPGRRTAERELSQRGVKLFWTTEGTLKHFDGASRWIARSIALFSDLPSRTGRSGLETHPHAVFFLLHKLMEPESRLFPKGTLEGRRQRLRLLGLYIDSPHPEGSLEELLPDHDAIDAAGAALMGALKTAGQSRPVGDEKSGGVIWIPELGSSLGA